MSSNSNIPEDNPYLEELDNSDVKNLWEFRNQSPNQNSNANSNPNFITIGEEGVPETYIKKVEKNNKKNKSQNSSDIRKKNNINNNSKKSIIIVNNNINIRNNDNNNDNINNDFNNDDKDSKIDDNKSQDTLALLLNNKIKNPFATTNTKYNTNEVVENSLKDDQNYQEKLNNDNININQKNPFYIPSEFNSSNNENKRNIIENSNNNINNNSDNIGEINGQKNLGLLIGLELLKNFNNLNINNNQNNNQNSININSNNKIPFHNINSSENKEQDIISKIKSPTLLVLKYLNDSSYLTSVLQLICSIRPLANFFSNKNNENFFKENVKDFLFSFLMSRLCFHLYLDPKSKKGKIYKPDKLIQQVQKANVVYKGYGEKNPNEFIVFILNKLNEELINPKYNNININIIFNYLAWFKEKEIKCQKCSKETKIYQNFLTFDLNVNDYYKYNSNKYIKIEDFLVFYGITRNKKAFCNSCKKYKNLRSTSKIFSSSNFLIFLLDLKGNENINFIIEKKINLHKFIKNNNINKYYYLNGIVFFDMNKNKYNTLCVSPVDKNWYLFDDENVELFILENFINLYRNNKNFIPHILLYNNIEKINE